MEYDMEPVKNEKSNHTQPLIEIYYCSKNLRIRRRMKTDPKIRDPFWTDWEYAATNRRFGKKRKRKSKLVFNSSSLQQ